MRMMPCAALCSAAVCFAVVCCSMPKNVSLCRNWFSVLSLRYAVLCCALLHCAGWVAHPFVLDLIVAQVLCRSVLSYCFLQRCSHEPVCAVESCCVVVCCNVWAPIAGGFWLLTLSESPCDHTIYLQTQAVCFPDKITLKT